MKHISEPYKLGQRQTILAKTSVFRAHSVFSVKQREWKSATALVSPGIYAAESHKFREIAQSQMSCVTLLQLWECVPPILLI